MQGQYLSKVSNGVAVGARFRIGLAEVSNRIDLNGVVNDTTSATVVVPGKVGGVTADAFPAASDCRSNETAAASRVVTGGATLDCMHLSCANKR